MVAQVWTPEDEWNGPPQDKLRLFQLWCRRYFPEVIEGYSSKASEQEFHEWVETAYPEAIEEFYEDCYGLYGRKTWIQGRRARQQPL